MIDRIEQALRSFGDGLALIGGKVVHLDWRLVTGGLALHVAAQVVRTRGWTNIIRAAYPRRDVPWRDVALASLTGSGANAILPARAGEPLKLFLVKQELRFTRYPTLISSLVPEGLFESLCGLALVAWLAASGLLPTSPATGRLPTIDVPGILRHPVRSAIVAVILLVALAVALVWARRRTIQAWQRLKQGFAILKRPRLYLTGVVTWQTAARGLRLVAFALLLAAFDLPSTLQAALLVMAAQSVGSVIQIPPGGTLLRVALLSYAFIQLQPGAPPDPAAVTAFAIGVPSMFAACNVVVGAGCLVAMTGSLDLRGAVNRARRATGRAKAKA